MRSRFSIIAATVFVVGMPLLFHAAPAHSEQAWVRREVRLNIRTGPGTQYRIVGVTKTNEEVSILERADGWTKIRVEQDDGAKEGWIQAGFLKPEAPPTIRLQLAEARVDALEKDLVALQEETEKLRKDSGILTTQAGEQQAKIKELTMENMELRAGARYPEWITGAAILGAGMLAGAFMHRRSARRQPTRIRL